MAKEIEVQGLKELQNNLDKFVHNFNIRAKSAMDKAAKNLAEDIKVTAKGGSKFGFKDRTGALRESIKGGLDDQSTDDNTVVGFVSTGEDNLGSNGKRTREYVEFVEYGEFSRAGSTSFLRFGVTVFQNNLSKQVGKIIAEELSADGLL